MYYDVVNPASNFPRLGWKRQVEVAGIHLKAPDGDGPGGRLWGAIGVKDGELWAVVFDSRIKNNHGLCPCDSTFTVFLSDVVPVNTVSSLIKEDNAPSTLNAR